MSTALNHAKRSHRSQRMHYQAASRRISTAQHQQARQKNPGLFSGVRNRVKNAVSRFKKRKSGDK